MKKLSLVLCLVLVFSLFAGCGNSAGKGDTTLTVWYWGEQEIPGYQAYMEEMAAAYSEKTDGITVEVPSQTQIIIKGADKQVVGEFAAKIRSKRPPEPYKGKGIKYSTEFVRRKEGKTGGKGKK